MDVDSGLMEAASDTGAGDKLLCQQILLDGGSDQCILNQFYRHFFLKLEPITYGCSLSGIGGKVSFQITHIGCISFMNRTIDNVYFCSELSKSVIAESILTATYDFRIVKEGVNCIITDTLNSLSATVKILFGSDRRGGHYLLPVQLFAHSPLIHSINLASVRPSNPLTLWHERLGHSHTALIRSMARSQLYKERGLSIPDSFLLPEKDPDLCDACALGKPTRDMSYTPQTRSAVKGALWYFDVSGGGDVVPSLKSNNRYIIMFADSYTRMYFDYYTKRVDDVTILKILKEFCEKHIMPLQRENDTFTFLRSDNGQLDTHGVRAYCRKKSILNQYTHPYHPNMLGFVERSFRSVKDLSRCMLQGANLPDPYWEKGNRYATLIRNILPNRSATGMV